LNKGILGGYNLSQEFDGFKNTLMISVTEKRTKEEIDMLVREMGECHV